jgi:hypothetical protein
MKGVDLGKDPRQNARNENTPVGLVVSRWFFRQQ